MPILPTSDRRARLIAAAFLVLAPLAYGALGVSLDMDANWDLRNYHWYNAYAFLTGRIGIDLLPAQMPSFYNPILDLPFYWLATAFPAPVAGFVWSAVQGLNLPLLFGLAMASLSVGTEMRRTLLAAALAAMGGLGGGTLGLLGTTFQDNVVSLGVLGAALVVVSGLPRLLDGPAGWAFARVAAGGVLAGAAMGAKNPTVIFAVGLCLAFLVLPARPWRRLWLAFFFGIGVLAGLAATGGFWMVHLWQSYGNPIFPHMNHVFKSPLAAISDYRNYSFLPADPVERVFFPFYFLRDPIKVGEVAWFDLRVPLLFALVPLAGLAALVRRPAQAVAVPGAARYLLTALAVTYALWVYMFCVYRYLVPVEMLAPLAVVLAAGRLPMPVKVRMGAATALLVLVQATMQPADWGRVNWSRQWVQADVPSIEDPDHTMLLMGGYWAISHVVPLFPPQMPVVRIQSNFLQPDSVGNGMRAVLERRVAEHKGAFLMLSTIPDTPGAAKAAALMGLTLDPQGCRPVPNNLGETLNLCPVRR
ncbi:hypothetical protein [Azospirillum sp. TSO22-1]|uniref:hypothetical protein n=1 Tax=Azospirillum sp. TSO22-1 TaxID=716789 RepID=UPI000D61C479|nr:hypothetical protein [Azospirillum sp. TSO22-1]PWC37064.1 hypothetical protein TSO221_28240 [Azospirillum sp. TSO22-1]